MHSITEITIFINANFSTETSKYFSRDNFLTAHNAIHHYRLMLEQPGNIWKHKFLPFKRTTINSTKNSYKISHISC